MEEEAENTEQNAEKPEAVEEIPAEEALAEDAAVEAEEPVAEDAPAEEPATEEPHPQAVTTPDTPGREAEEVSGSDLDPEVALAADAAVEAIETPKPAVPGADLEPIDLEPEAQLSAEDQARLEAEEEERARREAELVGEAGEEESATRAPAQMETGARYTATGKRKRSIARVILTPGDGKFEINQRTLEEYFPRPLHQTMARQPLASAGYEENVDIRIRVHGGGISGQAGAVRHGIARALTEVDPELRGDLKRRGFLTRDARVKERRKAGLKKARKKPQFSKR